MARPSIEIVEEPVTRTDPEVAVPLPVSFPQAPPERRLQRDVEMGTDLTNRAALVEVFDHSYEKREARRVTESHIDVVFRDDVQRSVSGSRLPRHGEECGRREEASAEEGRCVGSQQQGCRPGRSEQPYTCTSPSDRAETWRGPRYFVAGDEL